MKRQFLLLFFALLLVVLSSWAVDTGPVITISTPNTSTCGAIDVPVKVTNFSNVGAISLRLNYNSSVLSYSSKELNSKISSSIVNTSTPGTIKLGWINGNAINLSDNEVLFTLRFNILPSASGGNTDLSWGSDYREIAGVGTNPPVYLSTFNDLLSMPVPVWPVKNLTIGLGYCTIQAAVNAAGSGDDIEVSPGTYPEAVTINKNLKLHGKTGQMANTIILAPSTLPIASDPLSNIVTISGAGISVEISGLTVKGPGPSGCGSIGHGIFVRDGAYANIHNNQILDIRDTELPVSGCQNGIAIRIGRTGLTTTGTATIANNIIYGYQKSAIIVDNVGSSATITGNTITGIGTTAITSQNGIQISRGATATLSGNSISGNSYHATNAWDWGACGILIWQSGAVSLTGGNNLFGNDQSLYIEDVASAITLGAETFGASTGPITKGYYITDYSNQNIDASLCTFEGISLASASLTQLFNIEDRIWHSADDQAKTGFVKVKAGNVYVTRTETGAHIQNGIDAAVAGDMVNVQAGNYGIETAANRSVFGVNGPHVFGLFIDKANLTVRGYKSGDVPVASASEAAVLFQTGSTANFGLSGVFVQANGVTLEGLKIGDNVPSSNKTIEVVGDAFTLNKCFINTSSNKGVFYMGRWDATHPIVTYSITNNNFNNALVSINNGVGTTGAASGRLITGNTFTGVATPYLIGFRGWNGSSPAQGWILQPVGGAVVTGNIFNNTGVINYIIARGNAGGYDNSQLNWADIWNLNTYGNHVVTLVTESPFNVRSYTDAAGYTETRRISPKIQENVTIGQNGDVVLVSAGTYAENVKVTKNISLLSVNGAASSIIDGVNAGSEQGAIELVTGRDGVRIGSIGHGFTVKGIDGPAGSEKAAIYLQGVQSNITIEDNIIEARGDAALQGEWNAANDHVTINKNVITGQTFNGAVPATGDQFTVPNVARQAVAFGGGTSTTNTGNFIFTNNVISAITGTTAIGNGLVTLDLVGINDISGNTFTGQTGPSAWRPALRLRGSGTHTIKKNSFTGNFNFALERQGTTVDARENWWGHASGPYNAPQNLCGLGKAVSANVTFRPWYTDAAMTALSTTPAGPVIFTTATTESNVECVLAAETAPALPVVKDFCGTVLIPATPVVSGVMTGCEGTKIYTYTYSDALGQQLVWAYTYNIVRVTPPSQDGTVATSGGSVACASAATAPTILPEVKDVCGVVIATPIPVVSSVSCGGTKTFTYTYVDCAGKQFVWIYSYTISAPVVTMPNPQGSTVSCVSAATAPTPPVVLDNCGRTMTVSAGVQNIDPTCNGTKTWTFTYTDCAGVTYPWVYTYTITYSGGLTAPTAGASTVAGPAQAVNPGAPANITDACGRTVAAVYVGREPATGPNCDGTVVYTYRYTACDGTTTAYWTYTYNVIKSTVSGVLAYNNVVQTAMSGVTLTLNPGNLTSVTATDGSYSFTGLCPGNYTLSVTANNKTVGGVNSTDAGGVNYWSTHWGSIQHVNFLAGDATGDKFIAAADALAIQNQWVNDVPATPLWSYWKTGQSILANDNPYEAGNSAKPWPSVITVSVNGNVPNFDLYALCTGDFNGSYNSNLLKSTAQSLVLNSNKLIIVSATQEFELPIRAGSAMEVSAVSLVLQLPSKLVAVQDIRVNGSTVPVTWNVKGDELRIGWNSLNSVRVGENSNLLTLKLKATDAFTYGEYFDLALALNPANELADNYLKTIDGAILLAAKVGNGLVGVNPNFDNLGMSLNNYPNPFKTSTTLSYSLPVDGKVVISLYNNLGQLVNALVDANQNAGQYTIQVDGTKLTPGVYVAKLRLNNQGEDKVCTAKLVLMK